jgi:hypothetical protein
MKSAFSLSASFFAFTTLALLSAGCSDTAPVAPQSDHLGRIVQVKERPIEDFLLAQGGVAGSGMGASLGVAGGAIIWIDRSLDVTAVIDYAGSIHRREEWMSPPQSIDPLPQEGYVDDVVGATADEPQKAPEAPAYSGRIIEQVLSDGSARVVIDVSTTGALAFASNGSTGSFEKIFFGASSYRNVAAARGESRILLVYRTRFAGAPIPALSRLIYEPQPGEIVEQLSFRATAASSVALSPAQAMFIDFKAYGGFGSSLGAIGTLAGATISAQ